MTLIKRTTMTETEMLQKVCCCRYNIKDLRVAYPDLPEPVRTTLRGKFYDPQDVEEFFQKHGSIHGGITAIGWYMPTKMALDFVKGYYTNLKLRRKLKLKLKLKQVAL